MSRLSTGLIACLLLAACGTTVPVTSTAGSASGDGLTLATADPQGPGQAPLVSGGSLPSGTSGTAVPTGPSGPAGAPTTGRPATTQEAGPLPGPSALSAKGPGWDAKNVYLGFSSTEDQAAVIGTLGANLNPGSVQRAAKAIVADLNAKGGLLGRKVVPVFHDNATVEAATDPASASQRTCVDFTQDHRVIAVLNLNTVLDTPILLNCLKKAGIPLLSVGASTYDRSTFSTYGPGLWATAFPDLDAFAAVFVDTMRSNGYLGGWNTTTGAPASTPPVVGLLEPDTEVGHTTVRLLQTELQRHGVKVAPPFYYSPDPSRMSADTQAAVLKFRQSGVTHMVDITNVAAPLLFFGSAANSQGYYPRWAMTSWLLPQIAATTFAQQGLERQLVGAKGLGWAPALDVDPSHEPADTPARKACRAVLTQGGESINGATNRFALFNGYALCDGVALAVAAAKASGGLDGKAISAGLAATAATQPSRATFGNSARLRALPGAFRSISYIPSCTCFTYTGATGRF